MGCIVNGEKHSIVSCYGSYTKVQINVINGARNRRSRTWPAMNHYEISRERYLRHKLRKHPLEMDVFRKHISLFRQLLEIHFCSISRDRSLGTYKSTFFLKAIRVHAVSGLIGSEQVHVLHFVAHCDVSRTRPSYHLLN